jgi:hypothetical protein
MHFHLVAQQELLRCRKMTCGILEAEGSSNEYIVGETTGAEKDHGKGRCTSMLKD